MRYYFATIRMAIKKKSSHSNGCVVVSLCDLMSLTSFDKVFMHRKLSNNADENVHQAFNLKKYVFLEKLNPQQPYDPDIPFLVIYYRERKIYVHTKNCVWTFIATLYTVAQNCNQHQHPSTDEYIK